MELTFNKLLLFGQWQLICVKPFTKLATNVPFPDHILPFFPFNSYWNSTSSHQRFFFNEQLNAPKKKKIFFSLFNPDRKRLPKNDRRVQSYQVTISYIYIFILYSDIPGLYFIIFIKREMRRVMRPCTLVIFFFFNFLFLRKFKNINSIRTLACL